MSRPLIRIHDIETNETIDREMTVAEFKVYEAEMAADAIKKAEIDAKQAERQAERQAILDRLGLTADEVKLLLG